MEWMFLPLKRYADFDGRSRRKEFWMFFLLNVMVYTVVGILLISAVGFEAFTMEGTGSAVDDFSGFGAVGWLALVIGLLWLIGTIIPNIAVAVRRFHDRDMSGWWYLGVIVAGQIPVVGTLVYIGFLIFMALPGTQGPNRFGDDPKGENAAEVFT